MALRFDFTPRCGSRSGAAMVEYVMVAAMLLASVAVLSLLLYTFREHAGRVLELVASEYP